MPRAEPRARRRARRRCSAAPNRGGDGPRLRAPAVSRRAGGRRGARPRSKCVVPDANATAHERFAPSSTAAGTPLGGKVVLEATPRSPGPLGGEGERSRANGAIFGRTASRRDEIFRREGRSRWGLASVCAIESRVVAARRRTDAPIDDRRPRTRARRRPRCARRRSRTR